jgi:hypothetical protein
MTTTNHYHAYISTKEREIWEEIEMDEKIDLKASKYLNGPVIIMAPPQFAYGGDDLQTWMVAANILNKKSR